MKYRILPCGESAVTVEFSREITPAAGAAARALAKRLEASGIKALYEIIPAYSSVTIVFDPSRLTDKELAGLISRCMREKADGGASFTTYRIPVCYGGSFGEDLPFVASRCGLDEREVVRRHISVDYLITMLGFLPGFPYLAGMDETIAAPRLETPRTAIPAGSVGIGGSQTGIYPMTSPGGWRLIGRTPVRLYDPHRTPSVIYRAGDRIRFYPVTSERFKQIEQEIKAGSYVMEAMSVK